MKNLQVLVSDVKSSKTVIRKAEPYFCGIVSDLTKSQELTLGYRLTDCEEEILLEGDIQGNVSFECSRCLENVTVALDIKICNSFPSTQETIDVDDEARQSVVLNLPDKPLCNEDCKGICIVCGKNKNREACECSNEPNDPRWDVLNSIFNKKV